MSWKKTLALSFSTFVALAVAGQALACPVCFGETDSPVARGAELSILFMAVLTYFMILGGFVLFFVLRRRARRRVGGDGELSAESA